MLAGSRTVTADGFAHELNGPYTRIRHLSPRIARILGHVLPSLPAALVDVMLDDTVPLGDPVVTAKLFGVRLHGVEEIWR